MAWLGFENRRFSTSARSAATAEPRNVFRPHLNQQTAVVRQSSTRYRRACTPNLSLLVLFGFPGGARCMWALQVQSLLLLTTRAESDRFQLLCVHVGWWCLSVVSTCTSTTVDRFSYQNVLNINVSPGVDLHVVYAYTSSIRGCNLLLWTQWWRSLKAESVYGLIFRPTIIKWYNYYISTTGPLWIRYENVLCSGLEDRIS